MPRKKKKKIGGSAAKGKSQPSLDQTPSILESIRQYEVSQINEETLEETIKLLGLTGESADKYLKLSLHQIHEKINKLFAETEFTTPIHLPIGNRTNYQEILCLFYAAILIYQRNKNRKNLIAINDIVKTIILSPIPSNVTLQNLLLHFLSPKILPHEETVINRKALQKVNKVEVSILLETLTLAIKFGFNANLEAQHYHACLLSAIANSDPHNMQLVIKKYIEKKPTSSLQKRPNSAAVPLEDFIIGKSELYQTQLKMTNLVVACEMDYSNQCLETLIKIYRELGINPNLKGSTKVTPLHAAIIELQQILTEIRAISVEIGCIKFASDAQLSIADMAKRLKILMDNGCNFDEIDQTLGIYNYDQKIHALVMQLADAAENPDVAIDCIRKFLEQNMIAVPSRNIVANIERRHCEDVLTKQQHPNNVHDMLVRALKSHKPDSYALLSSTQEIIAEEGLRFDLDNKETLHKLISHNLFKLLELVMYFEEDENLAQLQEIQKRFNPTEGFDREAFLSRIADHDFLAHGLPLLKKIEDLMAWYGKKFPKNAKADLLPYEMSLLDVMQAPIEANPEIKLCILTSNVTGINYKDIAEKYPDKGKEGLEIARIYSSAIHETFKSLYKSPMQPYEEVKNYSALHALAEAYRNANRKRPADHVPDTFIAHQFNSLYIPDVPDRSSNNLAYQLKERNLNPGMTFNQPELGKFFLAHGLVKSFEALYYRTSGRTKIKNHFFSLEFFARALSEITTLTSEDPENHKAIQAKYRILYLVGQDLALSDEEKARFLLDQIAKTKNEDLVATFFNLICCNFISKQELFRLLCNDKIARDKKDHLATALSELETRSLVSEFPEDFQVKDADSATYFLSTARVQEFKKIFNSQEDLGKREIIAKMKTDELPNIDLINFLLDNLSQFKDFIEHEEDIRENLNRNIQKQAEKTRRLIDLAIYYNNEELLQDYLKFSSELLLRLSPEDTASHIEFLKATITSRLNVNFPFARNNLITQCVLSHIDQITTIDPAAKEKEKQSIVLALLEAPEVSHETALYALRISKFNPFAAIQDGESLFYKTYSDVDPFKNVQLKRAIAEYCLNHDELPALSQEQVNLLAKLSIDWNYDQGENKILNKLFELGYDLPAPDFSSPEICPVKKILISKSIKGIQNLNRSKLFPFDNGSVFNFLRGHICDEDMRRMISGICSGEIAIASPGAEGRDSLSELEKFLLQPTSRAPTEHSLAEEAAVNAAELIKEEGRLLEEKAKNAARKAAKKAKAHQEKLRAQQEVKEKAQRKAEEQKRLQLEKEARERAKQEELEKQRAEAKRRQQEALAKERKEELQRQQEALAKERQIAAFKERRIKRIAQRAATKWRQNVVDSKNMQGRADQFHKGKLARKAWQAWKSYQEKARAEKTFINEIDSFQIDDLLDKFRSEQDPRRLTLIKAVIKHKAQKTSPIAAEASVQTDQDLPMPTELQEQITRMQQELNRLKEEAALMVTHNGKLQGMVYDLQSELRKTRQSQYPLHFQARPFYPIAMPVTNYTAMGGPPPPTHVYSSQSPSIRPESRQPEQTTLNPRAKPFEIDFPVKTGQGK